MICCFFGHRYCPDLTEALLTVVEDLILNEKTSRFYVGGQGGFDHVVQNVLEQMQQEHPHITCLEVLAYMPGKKAEFPIPKRLETIYPDGLENVPRKYAIDKRNRWMVDQSDMVVCYIEHQYGGAAKFVELAKRKGKRIINLAERMNV